MFNVKSNGRLLASKDTSSSDGLHALIGGTLGVLRYGMEKGDWTKDTGQPTRHRQKISVFLLVSGATVSWRAGYYILRYFLKNFSQNLLPILPVHWTKI